MFIYHILLGVVNGPFKNTGLTKCFSNFSGLVVSIFARIVSVSDSQNVSNSYCSDYRSRSRILKGKKSQARKEKRQSRRHAKSRSYHSPPLLLEDLPLLNGEIMKGLAGVYFFFNVTLLSILGVSWKHGPR